MPNWIFILLSFLPCFPFNQVLNAMCYIGYGQQVDLSLHDIYSDWGIYYCLLAQIAYTGLMFLVVCLVDSPLHVSSC